MIFSKAAFNLSIPTHSPPILRVNIKYVNSLSQSAVLESLTREGQEGRFWVTQEATGIIDQKILFRSSPVKGNFFGWICLDNSSYDEYPKNSKEFWGHHPEDCPQTHGEGKMGRTVMPYSHVMEAERERLKPFFAGL
jgi:hypothetical protein